MGLRGSILYHGPLIFWMHPVFGMRGATYLLGVSEWLFRALLLAGFWNRKSAKESQNPVAFVTL
jgi:hypothetical protein